METPQQRLERFIKENFKSKSEFARQIGMSPVAIFHYIGGGKSKLGFDYGKRLETLGLSYEWYLSGKGEMLISNIEKEILMTGQGEMVSQEYIDDLLNVPIIEYPAHALNGANIDFNDLPISYKKLYIGMKLPLTIKGIRVLGDSLKDAGIPTGSYVLYDDRKAPYNGCEVIAILNGSLIVKHYDITENGFELYSINGKKTIFVIEPDDRIRIVGVVRVVLNYRS